MTPIDLFARLYDLPPFARTRLLSAGIPRVLPIARGLRIHVDALDLDVDGGRARSATSMPFTRRSRNHVGSIYLGALLVQAEVTMATLVIGLCRPPAFRVLVTKNTATYHARATKLVRAECVPSDDERAALARLHGLVDGKGDAALTVRLREAERDIATFTFDINVRHRSRTP